MKTVLDVNILASAAGSQEGLPFRVYTKCLELPFELIVSEEMLKSLDEVLRRPYFAKVVTDSERATFLAMVERNALVLKPDPAVTGVADDNEDDRVLGTAVAGRAEFIVSGGTGLLALNPFLGIPIVTARTFLDLFGA